MVVFEDEVRRQLALWEREYERPLWQKEDLLIVAVSGGPDSMALLHLLSRLGLHEPARITVAHLDHMLRESSSAEAQVVSGLCAQWGLRCVTRSIDAGGYAQKHGLTLEEAARFVRYRFLGEVAVESGSRHVIVGHNADDQVETILMNLLRGAGLTGLRGMQPLSRVPGYSQIHLIRPLLTVSRELIDAYCDAYQLAPLDDPSNRDKTFLRNRVRHELLPVLEDYNPQIRDVMRQTAALIRADVEYLELHTDAALRALVRHSSHDTVRLDLLLWRQLPLGLRRRTLRQAVLQLRQAVGDLGFVTVEQARLVAESGDVGSKSSLPGDLVLEVEYDSFLIYDRFSQRPSTMPQIEDGSVVELTVPGVVALHNGWMLNAEAVAASASLSFEQDRWHESVDADSVGALFVRTRREGERMQPLGMKGQTRKLADVMADAKIPVALRAQWPIVVNQDHVVWVVGIGLDERVRINQNTRRVIQLRSERIAT